MVSLGINELILNLSHNDIVITLTIMLRVYYYYWYTYLHDFSRVNCQLSPGITVYVASLQPWYSFQLTHFLLMFLPMIHVLNCLPAEVWAIFCDFEQFSASCGCSGLIQGIYHIFLIDGMDKSSRRQIGSGRSSCGTMELPNVGRHYHDWCQRYLYIGYIRV